MQTESRRHPVKELWKTTLKQISLAATACVCVRVCVRTRRGKYPQLSQRVEISTQGLPEHIRPAMSVIRRAASLLFTSLHFIRKWRKLQHSSTAQPIN